MTHEYGDPLNPQAFNRAVEMAVALARKAPLVPLARHVDNAVHQAFCSCAIDIEDEIENRRSGMHESIAREVRRRAEDRLAHDGGTSEPKR